MVPQRPVLAFAAGFTSHFLIDAIPHKDYDGYLPSFHHDKANPLNNDMRLGKAFMGDLALIGSDALFGLILSVLVFSYGLFELPLFWVLLGAGAAMVPDALQFVYFKTRSKILEPLQRLHIWIQQKSPLDTTFAVGFGLQCILVVVVIGFVIVGT